MDVSGGLGRCDCSGRSRLSRAWSIFTYLMLVFLLIPGGGELTSSSRAVPWRGFLSPLPSPVAQKQSPSFSSGVSAPAASCCCACGAAAQSWARAERCTAPAACPSSQTNYRFLSSLGSAGCTLPFPEREQEMLAISALCGGCAARE